MWQLNTKYLFKGKLELKTALHIGGGKMNWTNSDSPVVRTPEGLPFIPGSSFKGVFRSTVEKIAAALDIPTCQLIEDEQSKACPTSYPKTFAKQIENMKENDLVKSLEKKLCATCKLFGSPYTASKIIFHDLKLLDWAGATQVRDGVVIDRDSERAVDKLKYDFEVVPPSSTFDMEIWLENSSDIDLGLACVGLNEYLSGMGYLGGIKSRGLGNCLITDLKIYCLDLTSSNKEQRLKNYLIHTDPAKKMEQIQNPKQFIQEKIEGLLTSRGASC